MRVWSVVVPSWASDGDLGEYDTYEEALAEAKASVDPTSSRVVVFTRRIYHLPMGWTLANCWVQVWESQPE